MLNPFFIKDIKEAGCDEAGRGCLAGPVFAAAVIFSNNFNCGTINDSKKLSAPQRNKLKTIIEKNAISFSVQMVSPKEIDRINILNASIFAMHKAVEGLSIKPQHLLIDGNRFKPYDNIPYKCIVKGDSIYLSIAAASILAKTYRDEYMEKLSILYPEYAWERNKGYPTKDHRLAIQKYGLSPHHRRSFKNPFDQLEIMFK